MLASTVGGAAGACSTTHPATCPTQAGLCPSPTVLVPALFTTTSFPEPALCLSN